MSEEARSQVASVLAALVGLYVALSPIWTTMTSGVWISAVATGSVIVIASLAQLFTKSTIPSWIVGIAAIWLVIGAFVFGNYSFAIWSQVVAGIVAFLLASWDGSEIASYNAQHRQVTQ